MINIPDLFFNDGDEDGNGEGFDYENVDIDKLDEILGYDDEE